MLAMTGRGLPAPAPSERAEALLRREGRRIARCERLLRGALTIIVLVLLARGVTVARRVMAGGRLIRRDGALTRQPLLARLGLGDLRLALLLGFGCSSGFLSRLDPDDRVGRRSRLHRIGMRGRF